MTRLDGIRILIVDDHAVVRSSLALFLEKYGASVVGEAADGETAIAISLQKRPDVILMDISLPKLDGISASRRITEQWPQARILALTMHSEDAHLDAFLNAGGSGYVRKSAADRAVLDAVFQVYQGETYLEDSGVEYLVAQHRTASRVHQSIAPDVLSDRERTVLEQTVRGFTSKEIGDQLGISPRTVDTYRARLMEKLNLTRRHELVDYALEHNLLK